MKEGDGEDEYGEDGGDAGESCRGGEGEEMRVLEPPVPSGTQHNADENVEYTSEISPLVCASIIAGSTTASRPVIYTVRPTGRGAAMMVTGVVTVVRMRPPSCSFGSRARVIPPRVHQTVDDAVVEQTARAEGGVVLLQDVAVVDETHHLVGTQLGAKVTFLKVS